MSESVQESTVNEVIRNVKADMANPEIWEAFATWGETHEQALKDKADKDWNYHMFDLTMSAIPSTAKRNIEGDWLTGYLFTVEHVYMDEKETILGTLSDRVFLAFNTDAKISELIPRAELGDITTVNKPS